MLDGLRGIGGMNVPVSLYISSSYIDLFFIPTLPGEFVNTLVRRIGPKWRNMTLPEYISSRRELDNMTMQQVREVLIKRGKITENATHKDVEVACAEARRLFNLYLR